MALPSEKANAPALRTSNPVTQPSWLLSPWGVLAFLFAVQVLTGTLMMTVYSPSPASAWGSVWYLQTQLPGGWFVRGIHEIASNAMVLVAVFQVVLWIVKRLYHGFRFTTWAVTVVLVPITLTLALSGELLPWDQHGYWGTQVRLNILARTPFIGDFLKEAFVGGSEFGRLTLTRFYTLHIVVLPGVLSLLLWWHYRSRRNASLLGQENVTASSLIPQALRDSLVFALVFAAIALWVWKIRSPEETWLTAPADPTSSDYPARPEWHTLFLYQWLKYFRDPFMEMIGAIIIPGVVLGILVSLPLMDRKRKNSGWIVFPGLLLPGLGAAIGILSFLAVRADQAPPKELVASIEAKQAGDEELSSSERKALRAHDYQQASDRAVLLAQRSFQLAAEKGIPAEGPLALLQNDPTVRGPQLFAAHCASCHRIDGHNGLGRVPEEPATSSDLFGFASNEWIRSFLADPMADRFFGLMRKDDGDPAHTKMSRWISEQMDENESDDDRRALLSRFDDVAAYLADEGRNPGRLAQLTSDDAEDRTGDDEQAQIHRGRIYFMDTCNECHRYNSEQSGTTKAPEMLGYGSVDWIEKMIADPTHDSLYRSRGRERAQMPSFKDRLSPGDRMILAQWIHDSRADSSN